MDSDDNASSFFRVGLALAVFPQDAANTVRMVRHPKDLFQNGGNARRSPLIASKTKGFRPAPQQGGKLAELFSDQRSTATRSRMTTQGVQTAIVAGALEPLTDRAL